MSQPDLGLFDDQPARGRVPLVRQAARIEQILLGKRASLERFSKPGRTRWPDVELDNMRVAIAELEAVHATLLGLCAQEQVAA